MLNEDEWIVATKEGYETLYHPMQHRFYAKEEDAKAIRTLIGCVGEDIFT